MVYISMAGVRRRGKWRTSGMRKVGIEQVVYRDSAFKKELSAENKQRARRTRRTDRQNNKLDLEHICTRTKSRGEGATNEESQLLAEFQLDDRYPRFDCSAGFQIRTWRVVDGGLDS